MLAAAGTAAALAVLTVLPATAATSRHHSTGTATTTVRGLVAAYTTGRHLPAAAVRGVRPGSLRTGTAAGRAWAIVTFVPAARDGAATESRFQDGADTGVFTRSAHRSWRLVNVGPYGCGWGLPATLRRAWHLGEPAACHATAAAQRRSAAAARSAARTDSTTADTSSLGQRIADIALSQVGTGVTPVSRSFSLDCNPYSSLVAGFSANANGCGVDTAHGVRNENEEWCADFSKWVWERAGVTADLDTLNAGAVSFYQWALDQGESPQSDTGTPEPGDAVVFFSPGKITPSKYAVHVGIVTAVHPDGTVDMANGDFRGKDTIRVEYDTDIHLTNFAAQIYGAGEQWVLVTPQAAQHAAPTVELTAPGTAVSGSVARFAATATEPEGSIARYYWTFGDGRSANTVGPRVSHVFAGDGTFPVSVTVTSNFGTARTLVQDVTVVGASSAVASVPSNAVWFASTPVDQYRFVRSSSGDLAVDVWDGASWLQETAAGQAAPHSGLTALAFPDPAANDATTPHAYFRDATGSLAQTYLGSSGWVTQQLGGSPAPDSAIVASTTPDGGVAVFYADADGRLVETSGQGSSWTTSTPAGPPVADAAHLALATTAAGPTVFYVAAHGLLVAATPGGPVRPVATDARAGTALAALTTGDGDARVFFADRAGSLATATRVSTHGPAQPQATRPLPGTPFGASLAATNYLLPASNGPVINGLPTAPPVAGTGEEIYYLTAGGQPAVTYTDGGAWQSGSLPGTATGVLGADAYQVAEQPSRVILAGDAGEQVDSAATPSGPWTATPLPAAPASFADRVLLYAATAADQQMAAQAATDAGLPANQVTTSYATAWDAVLSGNYLVISVGPAAASALYYNVCGWPNPSGDVPGSTPFYLASSPRDSLPGADAFENATAADPAQAQARATDLAYYAVHGAYPPGVTSLPAAAYVRYACAGSPS